MIRTLLFILVSSAIIAQDGQYLAEYHNDYGLIITHEISAGQTIYGLTKHFGGDVEHTIELNDQLDFTEVSIGDQLQFTLRPHLLDNHRLSSDYVNIQLEVQKGQTLYSIAKVYAQKEVSTIMQLNNLTDHSIQPGQILLIGYVEKPYGMQARQLVNIEAEPVTNLNPTKTPVVSNIKHDKIAKIKPMTPITQVKSIVKETPKTQLDIQEFVITKNAIDSTLLEAEEPYIATHEKGLAYWQSIDSNNKDLIVLHKNAPINESITLFNPMMGREVKATVVAAIPEKSYPDNISVVISPAVAEALGALDKRFIVEMTY